MSATPLAVVRVTLLAALFLCGIKLWLTAYQALQAAPVNSFDDLLFIELAESLLRGEWLGEYSANTLVKVPFYSIWIALIHTTGIPLLWAQ